MIEADTRSGATPKSDRPAAARKGRMPVSLRLREALLRIMAFYWDAPVTFARLLWRLGMKRAAVSGLRAAFDVNPWDAALGQILCDMSYELGERSLPLGTMERSIFIVRVLVRSHVSERVTEAYFANLDAMLRQRARRGEPGTLVLGLGAGRVGSTTLANIVGSNPAAMATHENPPFLWWQPQPDQLEFHTRRFRLLLPYAPIVFDGAHWWLNALEHMFSEFPTAKAIGLVRDVEANVRSFARLPLRHQCGHASLHNGLWNTNRWSTTRPAYRPPASAKADPDAAKVDLIRRYVVEYNERLRTLAARTPERFLLLATEELDSVATRQKIGDFLNLPVTETAVRLNVGMALESVYHPARF